MLPFKLVYHPGYDLNLGDHVFPSKKFRLIHDRLLEEGFAAPGDFIEPEPASDADLQLVHEEGWVRRLKTGTLGYRELAKLEIPYSPEMTRAFWLAAGGSILAARAALEDGIGFNIGGGFHHAFSDHGEGFCAIHDVAVAIRKMQQEGRIKRAMVIDCDVHQGNGTAGIFAGDPSVFTFSIHQFNNYPTDKPPSTCDIHLPDGVKDEEYLQHMEGFCARAMAAFAPEMVFYVAGADPYFDDQLGGLSLTIAGLKRRDRLVMETALAHKAPVVVTLAGGYANDINDTVAIHCNTAKTAQETLVAQSR